MLKIPFCKYWTSIKPKLGWPVWNLDGNGTGTTTTAKNEVLLGYNKNRKTIQGLCAWWSFKEVNFCN